MPRDELRFSIEKVTEENHGKWANYFKKEYRLLIDISDLCNRINSIGDTEALRTFFRKNYRISLESVFGAGVLEDENKLQKAICFLKKMGEKDRIGEFYDPILNSVNYNKLGGVPSGYYVASCHANNDVVMSMLVVQSPDQQVQTHQYIFRSLGHLVKEAMENTPPFKSLSLPLHDFAGKALGSSMVVTRPVHQMTEILRSQPEFKIFQNLNEEKQALGEENWNYMKKYGIGDTRYPMTYRKIPRPELAQVDSVATSEDGISGGRLIMLNAKKAIKDTGTTACDVHDDKATEQFTPRQ